MNRTHVPLIHPDEQIESLKIITSKSPSAVIHRNPAMAGSLTHPRVGLLSDVIRIGSGAVYKELVTDSPRIEFTPKKLLGQRAPTDISGTDKQDSQLLHQTTCCSPEFPFSEDGMRRATTGRECNTEGPPLGGPPGVRV
jgi:hypothetical protein